MGLMSFPVLSPSCGEVPEGRGWGVALNANVSHRDLEINLLKFLIQRTEQNVLSLALDVEL